MTIDQVVEGLSFLFYEPNPTDHLNKAAAELMGQNIAQFQNKVLQTFRGGTIDGFACNLSVFIHVTYHL